MTVLEGGSLSAALGKGLETPAPCTVQLRECGNNRFEALERLGAGSYGVVLKCRDSVMDSVVAVKKMKEVPETSEDLIRVLREAQILVTTPRHPNIVRCLDAYMSLTGRVYLVFEHVDRTLSRELLFRPQGLSSMSIKIIFWQLLNGTAFLHSRRIIHRDLKPANVLLTAKGVVKICDFGFACSIDERDELDNVLAITRWYRAPEVLAEGEYGPGVDVWALGCILAELCTGAALLSGEDRIDQLRLIAGLGVGEFSEKQEATIATDPRLARYNPPKADELPTLKSRMENASPELLDLVQACLTPDPLKRPSANELMRYAWLEGVEELVPEEALEHNFNNQELLSTSLQRLNGTEPVDLSTAKAAAADISSGPVLGGSSATKPVGISRPAHRGIVAPSPVYKPLMSQLLGEDKLLQVQADSDLDMDDNMSDGGFFQCDAVVCSSFDGGPMSRGDSMLLMQLASTCNDPGSVSPVHLRPLSPLPVCNPGGRHNQTVEEFEAVQEHLGDMGLEVVGKVRINNGWMSPEPSANTGRSPQRSLLQSSSLASAVASGQPGVNVDVLPSRAETPEPKQSTPQWIPGVEQPEPASAQWIPGMEQPAGQPFMASHPVAVKPHPHAKCHRSLFDSSEDVGDIVGSLSDHLSKTGMGSFSQMQKMLVSPDFRTSCHNDLDDNFYPGTPRLHDSPTVMPLKPKSITPGP